MSDPAQRSTLIEAVKKSLLVPLRTTALAKDEIELELQKVSLGLATDNRNLRKIVAAVIGIFLLGEIIALFVIVIAQGLGRLPFTEHSFSLEQWTFDVFTSAVLLQTFGLARLVVRNLFPTAAESAEK